MATFDAFWVEQNDDGLRHQIVTRDTDDLPEGDVLVEVFYSSLNYKDGMSAKAAGRGVDEPSDGLTDAQVEEFRDAFKQFDILFKEIDHQ